MSHYVALVKKHTDMQESHAKRKKRATKSDTSGHCLGTGPRAPPPPREPATALREPKLAGRAGRGPQISADDRVPARARLRSAARRQAG